MKNINFKKIWFIARLKANRAVQEANITPAFGNCGFAWIHISGRGKFAKFAKETLDASKSYPGSGLNIWYSKVYDSTSQDMSIHLVACEAAVKVLRENGIKCSVQSRLD